MTSNHHENHQNISSPVNNTGVTDSQKTPSRPPSRLRNHRKLSRGAKNLIILGIGAVLTSIATTSVSLIIYHNSGDIYLDRSRPGYLPDEAEIDQKADEPSQYEIDKSGKIDSTTIDEYLEHFNTEIKAIDAYSAPFGAEALSNERLGIPTE